jgi:hypothetical protein
MGRPFHFRAPCISLCMGNLNASGGGGVEQHPLVIVPPLPWMQRAHVSFYHLILLSLLTKTNQDNHRIFNYDTCDAIACVMWLFILCTVTIL